MTTVEIQSSATQKRLKRYAAAVEAVERGEGPPWLPRAVEMLRDGAVGTEIADALGLGHSYLYAVLIDPTLKRERERKARYGGACVECGARTSYVTGGVAERCLDCQQTRHAERNERIVAAWTEGEPAWYIGEREGMSEEAVSSLIDHMRHNGRDIPLHRKRNREDWPTIEKLWNEGLTGPEIAARIGDNPPNTYYKIQAMRKAGIDLPTRASSYLTRGS